MIQQDKNIYKTISQSAIYLKNGDYIKGYKLIKETINYILSSSFLLSINEVNSFYSILISNLIDHFLICSNKERFLLVETITRANQINSLKIDLRHDHSVKLSYMLESIDYVIRIYTLRFIYIFLNSQSLDNRLISGIEEYYIKRNKFPEEVDFINQFIIEFPFSVEDIYDL